jgi:hypothetical protein
MYMAANGLVHSADIPVPFALAVHSIAKDEGCDKDWEILDQYGPQVSYAWIRSIYMDNSLPFTQEEQDWWSRELIGDSH